MEIQHLALQTNRAVMLQCSQFISDWLRTVCVCCFLCCSAPTVWLLFHQPDAVIHYKTQKVVFMSLSLSDFIPRWLICPPILQYPTYACISSPLLHTCWDLSSGRAPRPTAEANTARSRTSSDSGTPVTGRRLPSRSLRIHTPPGKTGEGPTRCSRSLHTVFLPVVGSVCSVQPPEDLQGLRTAAVWGW